MRPAGLSQQSVLRLWVMTPHTDAVTWVKLISMWGRSSPASSQLLLSWWGEVTRRGISGWPLAAGCLPAPCHLLTPQKCQIKFENLAYYFLTIVPRIEECPLHLSATQRSQVGWFTKHENNLPTAGTYTLKGENVLLAGSFLTTPNKEEIRGISSCF